MTDKKFPNPEEIQKEFEDFVKQRFGGQVQVFTNHIEPQKPQDSSPEESKAPPQDEDGFILNFNMKPKEITEYLDQYVISQNEAKKALAIAICDHYNHVREGLGESESRHRDYSKQNILILGPTGVGKTYLIRKIADLIGVPFVKADATRFSETGYVGANVDDLVRDLVTQADGDIDRAQYGIVYLDEADKIASPSNMVGRDVNGRGVQFGLLRLMEEAEVDLKSGNDIQSQMQAIMEMQRGGKPSKSLVNTRNILFIVSGAFTGLEEIIEKRLNKNAIGFSTDKEKANKNTAVLRHATTDDFIKFGFEPEFIGRLPVRVCCENLTTDNLYDILKKSKGSIIRQYEKGFSYYDIKAEFSDGALQRIAERAETEKTGARALMTICESALRNFKYELPSSLIKSFIIDKTTIDDPEAQLKELLSSQGRYEIAHLIEEVKKFEREFEKSHKMNISFNDGALELIAQKSLNTKIPPVQICEDALQGYQHGLKLIKQSTGQSDFVFGEEIINNPQGLLEKLIRESFNHYNK